MVCLMSSREHEFETYFGVLKRRLKTCSGRCEEIVIKIPDFLDLFIELMRDSEKVGGKERKLLSAAIAYVFVPYDVKPQMEEKETNGNLFVLKEVPSYAKTPKPESVSTEGYIDDAFLCSEVLLRLKEPLPKELIETKWKGEENIFKLAKEINKELKQELEEETRKNILKFIGLSES